MASVSGAAGDSVQQVTLSQIINWDTTHLKKTALNWSAIAEEWEGCFGEVHRQSLAPGGTDWGGRAAEAVQQRTLSDLYRVRGLADHLSGAAAVAHAGASALATAHGIAVRAIAEARAAGFEVKEDLSLISLRRFTSGPELNMNMLEGQALSARVQESALRLSSLDAEIAAKITTAMAPVGLISFSEIPPEDQASSEQNSTVQLVDHETTEESPHGEAEDEANRRKNEIDAFREVFGRTPRSAGDWTTAAALDTHSYNPDNRGVHAQVRVVEIEPVPGQGVVRVSQWIEQRDVTSVPPSKRDLGNNRVADPAFDPANTKVTTYIDYENGLVVMRQNPSVEQDGDGGPGRVKVSAPEGLVQQDSDGAVRIRYDAANPFAPGVATSPPGSLEDHRWTVNGDLVFTPTVEGVRVDGTRTNYPSMEVYQDLPNGATRTVLIDPAVSGSSVGPAFNLPRHHEIGDGGRAFEPFDTGNWNPTYDVRVPLPVTELGPTATPPAVEPSRVSPGVTEF